MMATNFGTKIAINALIRDIIIKNVIAYNRGCRGWQIQIRHSWLQWSKGRCHDNEILAKIGKNLTKMATTSVVCGISMQLCFVIGFQLSANSSVTLPYTRDKGALPWQPILGHKLL